MKKANPFEEGPVTWFVYMLQCRDGSIYTGITNELKRRVAEHQNGVGCKYTRGRCPVQLIASRAVSSRSEALSLEWQVKKMDRPGKEKLAGEWNLENGDA
ncbi:MAG TPA: GIY-YIG nuclease family protein [Syntrophomonadaceae bacterium]|nr:GIY-YIG nuclease family protein [Syntrophomonadaceae bacterium]